MSLRDDMRARRECALEQEQPDTERIGKEKPFNPRNEVSADAQFITKRIVRTLWTIFVLLPVVVGIIYGIVNAK